MRQLERWVRLGLASAVIALLITVAFHTGFLDLEPVKMLKVFAQTWATMILVMVCLYWILLNPREG